MCLGLQLRSMPNYPTHSRWGRVGAVAMALAVGGTLYVLFEAVVLAGAGALGAAAATFVGSIYPDIDHHRSIPRRKATRAFRALVVLGVLSLAALGWAELLAAVETMGEDLFGGDLPAPPAVLAGVVVPGAEDVQQSESQRFEFVTGHKVWSTMSLTMRSRSRWDETILDASSASRLPYQTPSG